VAQQTAVVVLEGLLRLLHPFCPFITEELWQAMRERWGKSDLAAEKNTLGARTIRALQSESIMVAPWNSLSSEELKKLENTEAKTIVELLQEIVYAVRNIRGEMKVPPATATDVSLVCGDADTRALLERELEFIRRLVNVGKLEVFPELEPSAFTSTAIAGPVVVHVELPSEMREAEIARLEREVARVAQMIENQQRKLASEAFVSKAPANVVEKEKSKLAQLQSEYEQFVQKLKRLKEA
jgi:valyl-tRNA synthetase